MKVYLAGKMKGIKDLNYPRFFEMANALSVKFDWEVVNPAEFKYDDKDKFTYHRVLYRDFELVKACDGIYMMEGWEESPGASCELALARLLGKAVMFEIPTDASAIAWDMQAGVDFRQEGE